MSELDNATATVTVAPDPGTMPAAAPPADSAPALTETPAGEAQANPTDKPPSEEPEWFKQRIKQITRQRREEERRADRLAAENEVLRRTQPAPAKSADLRPQDFTDYSEYTKAVAKAEVSEQIGAATRSGSEQAYMQDLTKLNETFMEKATKQAEAAGIDLDDVLETLGQPRVPFTRQVMQLVAESDHTARLAEYLAENPAELDRVSKLGPALAKKALAKVEATFGAAPKPNATKAPPPVPTVGGRAVTQIDPSKLSMDDYAKYWAKREEAKTD